ncbi:hypothetical protein [Clostridium tagluense]|uniref:hypothetical protein n=1 Tax=Clostridium tagluense TaxID=360422 RepID=UPI001C0DF4AD|nr:hypothetical protein [Clostridium tagluense]MBU3130623.1 hypothetical protein [Clostridium tagluense]
MMKKNVVLLETINSTGSGILYPCKYNGKNKEKHASYYIIFTNRHVLKDIEGNIAPGQSVKELINLQAYDDTGSIIEKNDILDILAFHPEWKYDKREDVAALLVAIRDNIVITLETSIFRDTLVNREILYMEGYPGILLDDKVSQKIQLQGIAKSVFPESRKMGVFQITDDYHWYNNLQDRDLFRGMSGGTIYLEYAGKILLLGMNQSVSIVNDGQNPFKLVYYLRMEYILECLREEGCILFRRTGETEYQLEWVYGMGDEIREYINKPSFLLIGGSGAGKSSFAKDFAYHGDKLLATNDGQTTRTNVVYEYSIFCDEPKAIVIFMNQEEFCYRMSELQGAVPALRLIREIFQLSEDVVKSDMLFLENCFYLIQMLQRNSTEVKQLLEDVEEYLDVKKRGENVEPKKLIRLYEKLLEILVKYIPVSMVKYICDKKWLDDCRKQYQESYEKQYYLEIEQHEQWRKKFEEILIREDILGVYDTLKFGDILLEYFEGKIKFHKYQEKCLKYLKINKDYFNIKSEREVMIKLRGQLNDFRVEYLKELFYTEGFFNIEEFKFLKMIKKQNGNLWNEIEIEVFPYEKKETNEEGHTKVHDIDIWEGTQNAYKEVYKRIKEAIREEYGLGGSELKRVFNLIKMDEREKKQLQLCLQVSAGKSLTGMIRSIKIEDMISNEYAMLFSELKIAKIKMIDTYGLDHIEGKKSVEDTLYYHVYHITEDEKIKFKDISVLYIKKLDAGRPDELRVVLPCVRKVIPQAAVYCVFTGIDIFYKTPEEVRNIQWRNVNDEKVPKSVRYILSERGRDEITDNVVGENGIKRNMYLVLRNNLVPYCGKKEKIQKEYYFYRNNETYVRRLLVSIVMKEYSSLEIVDIKLFEDPENQMIHEIEQFILEVFKRASVNVKDVHWNTIRANVKSIKNIRKLGAWTTYRYQWNQRFHEAYSFVIARDGEQMARKFEGSTDAIEAALRNVEDSYLGTADNLCMLDIQEKNQFRELMEQMYDSNNYNYKYNPYKLSKEEFDRIMSNNTLRKEFFADVFDFAKGIRNNENLLKKFAKEFISQLIAQIESDNEIKAENIIHLNASFAETVKMLKTEFIEKYKWDDGEEDDRADRNFKEVLKAYITRL